MTSCFIHHSADLGTVDPNTRRKSNRCRARCTVVYLHGNGTDIGGVAEEAKALSRDLECHVVVPEYPGYGLAEGSSNEDSVDARESIFTLAYYVWAIRMTDVVFI